MSIHKKLEKLVQERGRGEQKRIAAYLLGEGASKADVAKMAVNVNRWIKGNRVIPAEMVEKLAKYFNISTDYLLSDELEIPLSRRLPVIGKASCGVPVQYFEDYGEYIEVPTHIYSDSAYAVVAEGDSMLPKITDGDTVICDREIYPKSGDIAHYTIDGESGIKKIMISEDKKSIKLIPLNPLYDMIQIDVSEYTSISLAKCTYVISKL